MEALGKEGGRWGGTGQHAWCCGDRVPGGLGAHALVAWLKAVLGGVGMDALGGEQTQVGTGGGPGEEFSL